MGMQRTDMSNKEQILQTFQRLLAEYQQTASTIKTKQEAAEREADTQIVESASQYTVESIVKGLADLQLDFGKSTDGLVQKLAVEAPKLEELRRAIRVEQQHADELGNIRIAADALDILIQEQQEEMRTFEGQSRQTRATLEHNIAETRQSWQNEQETFENTVQERLERLKKERKQQEADYQYELERTRKVEADDYAARKITLERVIADENARKDADWSEREQALQAQQDTLERYRTLAAAYPSELEQATEKAHREAAETVLEEAEIQAELFEKEHEANINVYELQIASLKDTLAENTNQLKHLSEQLQAALQQVQNLAAKAVSGKSV